MSDLVGTPGRQGFFHDTAHITNLMFFLIDSMF